jgi:LysM repeat protein
LSPLRVAHVLPDARAQFFETSQRRFLTHFPPAIPPSSSGDALASRRNHSVRGARLSLPTVHRAKTRVSLAATAQLSTHVVQSGENLWGISAARGVSLNELKAANAKALGRSDVIYPGQQLVVPPGGKRLNSSSVPSGYKPSGGIRPTYSAQAPARAATANTAALAKKQGLGLVTAGAFFIALAVGIWMFKDTDEPARPSRYGQGDQDEDPYGTDPYGGQRGNQNGGYYDRYNQGEWPQQNGQQNGQQQQQQRGYGNQPQQRGYDARQQNGGDYTQPPQWNGNNHRY